MPLLTGVAKTTIDNWLRNLQLHRYVTVGPGPGRAKLARLTTKGAKCRETYLRWADLVDQRWGARFGAPAVSALRSSLERLVGEPTADSPLLRGVEPYPDGWRAQVSKPVTLPHYPVISPRGGFPDGS